MLIVTLALALAASPAHPLVSELSPIGQEREEAERRAMDLLDHMKIADRTE